MTFKALMVLYREMAANVEGSFLERPVWKKLIS